VFRKQEVIVTVSELHLMCSVIIIELNSVSFFSIYQQQKPIIGTYQYRYEKVIKIQWKETEQN
jgi:hypothetical protein